MSRTAATRRQVNPVLPARHIVRQGRVLAALGGTALRGLRRRPTTLVVPGPELTAELPPRAPSLVRDYLRHVGGDPGAYRGTLPAHLFPQWSFPLAAATLKHIPYPAHKVLNGGCRLEVRAPLPAGERLLVRARLESVDDDGRRVVLRQRIITGTGSAPDALVADLLIVIRLQSEKTARSERPRVPIAARELAYWRLPADSGLAFALLTGDFNPLHWVGPYARAFGFRAPILHGFATLARAIEGLNRGVFAGNVDRLAVVDARFTRPLCLPARVGLYLEERRFFVGDGAGGPAYLAGSFEEKTT
jgi:acyl dehydratase